MFITPSSFPCGFMKRLAMSASHSPKQNVCEYGGLPSMGLNLGQHHFSLNRTLHTVSCPYNYVLFHYKIPDRPYISITPSYDIPVIRHTAATDEDSVGGRMAVN